MTIQSILPPLTVLLSYCFLYRELKSVFRDQSCSLQIASLLTLAHKFCLSRSKQTLETKIAKLSRKPSRLDRLQSKFSLKMLSFGRIKSNGFSLGPVGVAYKQHLRDSIYAVYSADKWKDSKYLLSLSETSAYRMSHSKVITLLRYWTDWISTYSVFIVEC